MSFSVNLYVKYDEIILDVVSNHCLPSCSFQEK